MERMIAFERPRFDHKEQIKLIFPHILYRLFVGSNHFDYSLRLPTYAKEIGKSTLSFKNCDTFL